MLIRYELVELMSLVFMNLHVVLLHFLIGIDDHDELEWKRVLDIVGAWRDAQRRMLPLEEGQNLRL